MIGGQGSMPRPTWMDHFDSPTPLRLVPIVTIAPDAETAE